MNRFALAALLTAPLFAQLPIHDWISRRFHAEDVQLRPIEGLNERASNGAIHLTLKTFLELALKNSTDINLIRLNVFTAADQITAAKAPLDPVLSLGFSALRSAVPESAQISGAQTLSTISQTSTLGYQQLLPTGQTFSSSYSALRSSTNDAFSFLNPNILGTFSVQFLQPLLQDRSRIQFKGPLQIARTQLVITSKQSEAQIADSLTNSALLYWNAVRARDFIKVQQQTHDLAQKSYERDKLALELGALAQLSIYQSQTQVAERKRDLIQAQYDYKASLDALRRAIGADLTPELRRLEIVLDDDPTVLPKQPILPYEEALAAALKTRPEASAARDRITVDELSARVAQNQLQPRLDLTIQAAGAGLAGTQVASTNILGVTTPATSTGFANSLNQVFAFNYPTYGAGLQFTFPLRNSSASAQLSDALVNRARDRYNERQIQQQIIINVRQAITAIEVANATIDAARTARDLAAKNVEAEQQKYELGGVTAFEVLDSQNRLASSENALLNAFVGYQAAFINYQRATWTLLDGLGMVLEAPKSN